MKAQKLTLSAAALMIVMTCSSAFAQDLTPPSGAAAKAVAAPSGRNHVPPAESAKKSPALNDSLAVIEPTSATPYRTFSSGTAFSLFRWTVSAHGNVVRLESPAGFVHLGGGEGYIVSMNTSIGIVRYFDAGEVEAGGCSGNLRSWSPIVFESGVNANGTTLIRDTCDGIWRLTQTFTMNAGNHELTITMTLRNLTGANWPSVRLDRYFDADMDNDAGDDVFTRTFDAVAAQDSIVDNLSLTAATFNTPHSTAIHSFPGWNRTITNQASLASPSAGDRVGRVSYSLGTINAGAARAVRVLYKRQ
jgi:hypothetical protein